MSFLKTFWLEIIIVLSIIGIISLISGFSFSISPFQVNLENPYAALWLTLLFIGIFIIYYHTDIK